MVIHRPKTLKEAVTLRHEIDNSVYLAGGTDDLRLNSSVSGNVELIDINPLCSKEISIDGDELVIGGCVVLQDIAESELVPEFIRDSARFCASYEKRNAATIGGNVALKRDDAYMIPALVSAEARLLLEGKEGEKSISITEYLSKPGCKGIIKEIRVSKDRKGWARKISHTSSSHATLIASESNGVYALEVSGSKLAFGNSPDLYRTMEFSSDLSGSAEYKGYLASVVFSEDGK